MDSNQIQILTSMVLYMLLVVCVSVYVANKVKQTSSNYFLGGRSLGPWVTAMSAEASDMSGWLLMGLPGVAYWCGIADAMWTAIGLAVGTYLNWLLIAKRLRTYSENMGDSITLPEFFSNRFNEKKKIILSISAVFILIFFTVYAASCFVTCGKLFSTLFGLDYHIMMVIGALFVIAYTLIGGFLAESVSDFIQAIVMVSALIIILIVGIINAGGISQVIENAKSIPGYFSLSSIANPNTNSDGVQIVIDGVPQFNESSSYGFITIISGLAWGLGYFGMPQVLLRFMAVRDVKELTISRRVATVWVVISLLAAVAIGVVGRSLFPTESSLLTSSGAENVFLHISQTLLPPLIAGVVMAGVLAATISSSDSYLLIATSAFARNIYQGVIKKDTNDEQVMKLSKVILLIISLIAIIIAWDENSVIFTIVSFAWAGFGATFGPLMIFSLFSKKVNQQGAIAGMLTGGITVFIWKLFIKPLGGIFGVYELLPAFILSCIAIMLVSICTHNTSSLKEGVVEDTETTSTLCNE
jgi:sodium/proline symporter